MKYQSKGYKLPNETVEFFTMELANRLKDTGVTCNAFHPGFVKSELGNNLPIILKIPYGIIQPFLAEECKTSVYLASSKEVENITGKFFKNKKPLKFSYDPALGEKLWKISSDLTEL